MLHAVERCPPVHEPHAFRQTVALYSMQTHQPSSSARRLLLQLPFQHHCLVMHHGCSPCDADPSANLHPQAGSCISFRSCTYRLKTEDRSPQFYADPSAIFIRKQALVLNLEGLKLLISK